MKRLPRLNALLLVVVGVLGALAWFRPAGDGPAQHPLSTLKAAEARSVRIERPGTADVVLEKKDGGWFLTAPLAARADEHRVQRLLEILGAQSAHKLTGGGLERFELDRPAARVTIGGQAFSFGMLNAVTREQYVATGDAVYAVHPRYGAALPAGAVELASRQLLAPGEVPERVALKEFTVERREGRWMLSPDSGGEPSQDDLARWIEGWRLASALRVEPHVGGKPRQDVEIRLKGGGRIALGVLASGPGIVLTRPDEKLQYHFRIEAAMRLLSPPGAAAGSPAQKK